MSQLKLCYAIYTGTDAPLRAQSMVGNALAGLKLAYAQEVADDR